MDTGCWGGSTAAHETMHNMGGVQMSAPHSSGGSHCVDEYDVMCYSDAPYYPPMQILCADGAHDQRFDCNHDDYYSTNPPANSYLATHWNTANNQFLIGASVPTSPTPTPTSTSTPTAVPPTPTSTSSPTPVPPTPTPSTLSVSSLVTGKTKGQTFTQTDTFSRGDTMAMRAHVVDQNGNSVSRASVSLTVKRPDGSVLCSASATSDSTGIAQANCKLPNSAPAGSWDSHLVNATLSGYTANMTGSVTDHGFTVQ